MSSVLEELWFGNIEPQEQFLSGNTHFKELVSLMVNIPRVVEHLNRTN